MNIEHEIASLPVHKRPDHKSALHDRLITHMEIVATAPQRSYRKLFFGLVLAPVAMIALLIGITVWQPSPDKAPHIVQQLTAKQVFALAEEHIVDPSTLKAGQYYYTKTLSSYISWNSTTDCSANDGIDETYLNSAGVEVMRLRYTVNGQLSGLSTVSEDGLGVGDEFFFDKAIDASKASPAQCPVIPSHPEEISQAEIDALTKDPVNLATQSLYSGTPDAQKRALQTLQASSEFSVTENVHIDHYQKPVIMIQKKSAQAGDTKYYFDQQTKQLVGVTNFNSWFVVLDQGIKQLPSHPEYKTTPPPQL